MWLLISYLEQVEDYEVGLTRALDQFLADGAIAAEERQCQTEQADLRRFNADLFFQDLLDEIDSFSQ